MPDKRDAQVVAVITYDDGEAHVTVMDSDAGVLVNEHRLPEVVVSAAFGKFLVGVDEWVK